MTYKYGEYTKEQISDIKQYIRKQIFFLLLCVDRDTKEEYKNVSVDQAFDSLLQRLAGLNELLCCPAELVRVMTLLEAARLEYNSPSFQFSKYRKLVLDAGNEVNKIKEVD